LRANTRHKPLDNGKTNLVALLAVDVVVSSVQFAFVDNCRREIIDEFGFVKILPVPMCRIWEHVDRQREIDPAFHFFGHC
jgi:hypothetical protein